MKDSILPLAEKKLEKKNNSRVRYTKIVDFYREQILEGKMPGGTRLPTEFKIAEEYKLSRGTVRQALNLLVEEGLLERVQGRGTFVSQAPFIQTYQPLPPTERRIGLILNQMSDQLNLDILIGVEQVLKSKDYQLNFAYNEEDSQQLALIIERLKSDKAAGLIIFPVSNVTHDNIISQLQVDKLPFVFVDRYIADLDNDYVVVNNRAGAYRATEHLLILGHTRIGFAHGYPDALLTTSVRDRFEGYRQALADYEVPFDEALLLVDHQQTGPVTSRVYEELLLQKGKERPEAIFVVNDWEALKVIQAAQRCDIKIPDDLALVGFDDLPFAAHLNPALTTIGQPRTELGVQAANLLLSRIDGEYSGPPRHIELSTNLIVRESCGARLRLRKALAAQASQ